MLLHYNPQDGIDKMQAPQGPNNLQPAHQQGYRKYSQLHPQPLQKHKSCSRDGTFCLNSYLVNNAAGLHSTWETWETTTSVKMGQLHCCRKKPCTCQQSFSGPSLPSSPQTQIDSWALLGSMDMWIMMITCKWDLTIWYLTIWLYSRHHLLPEKSVFHSLLWLNNIPL